MKRYMVQIEKRGSDDKLYWHLEGPKNNLLWLDLLHKGETMIREKREETIAAQSPLPDTHKGYRIVRVEANQMLENGNWEFFVSLMGFGDSEEALAMVNLGETQLIDALTKQEMDAVRFLQQSQGIPNILKAN